MRPFLIQFVLSDIRNLRISTRNRSTCKNHGNSNAKIQGKRQFTASVIELATCRWVAASVGVWLRSAETEISAVLLAHLDVARGRVGE